MSATRKPNATAQGFPRAFKASLNRCVRPSGVRVRSPSSLQPANRFRGFCFPSRSINAAISVLHVSRWSQTAFRYWIQRRDPGSASPSGGWVPWSKIGISLRLSARVSSSSSLIASSGSSSRRRPALSRTSSHVGPITVRTTSDRWSAARTVGPISSPSSIRSVSMKTFFSPNRLARSWCMSWHSAHASDHRYEMKIRGGPAFLGRASMQKPRSRVARSAPLPIRSRRTPLRTPAPPGISLPADPSRLPRR